MLEDQDGHIWVSGRHHCVFSFDGQKFKFFAEKSNFGSAILQEKTGYIWFDGGEKLNTLESFDGLWRYDGKTFTNFTTEDGMGNHSV